MLNSLNNLTKHAQMRLIRFKRSNRSYCLLNKFFSFIILREIIYFVNRGKVAIRKAQFTCIEKF